MGKQWEERLENNEMRIFLIGMFDELKSEIIEEVKKLLKQKQIPDIKKWVKSVEVKKLLNVSHGKLQTLRNSRTISFTKIGGTIYYHLDDIQRMMETRKLK